MRVKSVGPIWMVVGLFVLVTQGVLGADHYSSRLCNNPQYKCIRVKPSDTWEKLFPNERQRELVKRLNRMNIAVNTRQWIAIPVNLEAIDYMDLAPFPDRVKPTGKKFVIIKLSLLAFAAYDEKGHLVFWGPVSAGKGWCPDVGRACRTAVGVFKVQRKGGAGCVSNKFPVEKGGGAPMPYCVFYHGGFALHGSVVPGFHASHGCVRMFTADAQWLNQQFLNLGSAVIVLP